MDSLTIIWVIVCAYLLLNLLVGVYCHIRVKIVLTIYRRSSYWGSYDGRHVSSYGDRWREYRWCSRESVWFFGVYLQVGT